MTAVRKEDLRGGFQGILEGFAVMEVNAYRQIAAAHQGRGLVKEEWNRLDLGEFPDWEPDIRARRVS